MLHLVLPLRIFYALLVTSVVTTGVLLASYQRQRQNLLLRSCCLMLLCMYGAIVIAHIPERNILDEQNALCEMQGIFLNYCYICIHAHACFMMLSNCYVAMGWKLKIFEQYIDRELTLVLLAYSMPMLYIALFAFIRANNKDAILVRAGPFFCSIVRPRFSLNIAWFALFSVPGSILAGKPSFDNLRLVYLLFKTWRARQRTLTFGSSTQLTFAYLCRLSLSVFVYIVLAYGSFIPLMIYFMSPGNSSPLFGGRSSSNIPKIAVGDENLKHLSVLSYFPAVLGIAFFVMYGFGSHARAAYKHFAQRYLLCNLRRRNSAMPLIESNASPIQQPMDLRTSMEDFGHLETGPTRRSI